MKLSDPTHGLKHTALEALELGGETLDAHRDFWVGGRRQPHRHRDRQ
jgi:hypothetical protein